METLRYIWPAAALLGFAGGFIARKSGGPAEAPPAPPVAETSAASRSAGPHPSAPAAAAAEDPGPLPVSTDSMEDLLALDNPDLYGRLSLWLLDATEEDMAAFWAAYRKREDADYWTKDLVFTQWAKKNPQGLLEAARRDNEEGPAYWAWAMSDPDAALADTENGPDEMRNWVLRGIANFHPQRALAILEEDPGRARAMNISSLAGEIGKDDPEAGVEFLAKHSHYDLTKQLGEWAEKDPHAAFQWLKERRGDRNSAKGLIDKLAREQPEVLKEIAGTLSSGAMKREVESALFRQLAESDPEQALESARAAGTPLLTAQRLAQAGKSIAAEDPEKALSVLGELLAASPDAMERTLWTRYPDGASGGGSPAPEVSEFVRDLARAEPQRTLEALLEAKGDGPAQPGSPPWKSTMGNGPTQVARIWAAQDAEGFAAWCEQSGDDGIRDFGVSNISSHLRDQQDYEGAVAWAEQITDEQVRTNALSNVMSTWAGRDREAAEEWFQNADLTENERKHLNSYFPRRAK